MKHLGATALLLCVLVAALAAVGRAGPGLPLQEACKRCCHPGRVCPAICDLSGCPGQCPYVNKRIIRCDPSAPDTCKSDESCPRGQRCCDTGCSRNCSPVCRPGCAEGSRCDRSSLTCQAPPVTGGRPGVCPTNDLSATLCLQTDPTSPSTCDDDTCPKGQKCCSVGCGKQCVQPCLIDCGPDYKCVLKSVTPVLGDGFPPAPLSVPQCVPKDPCARVKCDQGFRCTVENYEKKCEKIPAPKPGTCPNDDHLRPVIFCAGNPTDECFGDDQCPKDQKCCKYVCARTCKDPCRPACRPGQKCVPGRGGTAATCKQRNPCALVDCRPNSRCVVREGEARCVTTKPSRPGFCPHVNTNIPCYQTKRTCRSDEQCKRGQKCCGLGCHRRCLPVCQRRCPRGKTCKMTSYRCLYPPCARCVVDKPKPGVCPRYDIITTCEVREDACTSDSECKGTEKCCSRGCGRTCVPVCPRPCPRGQTCKIPNVQCFAPPCNPSPSCTPDKPVKRPGVCPSNDIITTCEVREDACTSDAECKGGEKCCSRGCGKTCVPVCHRPCPHGQTCKIPIIQCLALGCKPTPSCVPNPKPLGKPGVCPRNDIVTTCQLREDACTSDEQCKGSEKCCPSGCGLRCVVTRPFTRPFTRPGTCPKNNGIGLCVVKNPCTSDAQCKIGEKCCESGCGKSCQAVPNLRG